MALMITAADFDDPALLSLLAHHQKTALAHTPRGHGHSLPAIALQADNITVFAAYDGGTPVGTIALKTHDATLGEIKAMHVISQRRGQGIADLLMDRLEAEARTQNLRTLALETHPGAYFAPAIRFYKRRGYTARGPFADYTAMPSSVFYGRSIAQQ